MLYRKFLRRALFHLPAETAHEAALRALSVGLSTNFARQLAARRYQRSPFGELKRFGLSFSNPIGVAAGFDKNGVVAPGLAALGFGFVEVGTVTDLPQPGNPLPRLFRLPLDRALIKRAGFNNDGAAALAARLQRRRPAGVLGVNIGKSRAVAVEAAVEDYLSSFEKIYAVADYVAVNVSSPNTPNLRQLQRADELQKLLGALQRRNRELAQARSREPLPLLLKIAPDLSTEELESIVDVVFKTKISGIIATNTTVSRDNLRTPREEIEKCGAGGLSGAPLRTRATEVISMLYRLTRGQLPIVGVGGIFTAADAWEKICAGASLVQVYTGLVYQGASIAREINDGLQQILSQENYQSFDQAIGSRAETKSAARAAS
ncbi:MAG: quinone-dependent dihydroorotate dehydrogenase [Pyrinomonadaceae bacterium]